MAQLSMGLLGNPGIDGGDGGWFAEVQARSVGVMPAFETGDKVGANDDRDVGPKAAGDGDLDVRFGLEEGSSPGGDGLIGRFEAALLESEGFGEERVGVSSGSVESEAEAKSQPCGRKAQVRCWLVLREPGEGS